MIRILGNANKSPRVPERAMQSLARKNILLFIKELLFCYCLLTEPQLLAVGHQETV